MLQNHFPIWSVIGGYGDKVDTFIGEFLRADELLMEDDEEPSEAPPAVPSEPPPAVRKSKSTDL